MIVHQLDCVGVFVHASSDNDCSLARDRANEPAFRQLGRRAVWIEQRAFQIGRRVKRTCIAQVQRLSRTFSVHAVAAEASAFIFEKVFAFFRIAQFHEAGLILRHRADICHQRNQVGARKSVRRHGRSRNAVSNHSQQILIGQRVAKLPCSQIHAGNASAVRVAFDALRGIRPAPVSISNCR